MKKIILIPILTLFCFMVNAQDKSTRRSDISFGLKGGLNFSMISGDDTDGLDGRIDFHIGVVNEIPISDKFSFQPEILYSSQGDKMSIDDIDIDFNFDYHTKTINCI